mmetsp:Transcript_19381/g.29425  ORF Transcript_19381/g.29425 Transcript_19381/m.29425 type:complete len:373 (+) Transcript_19381:72-1190(+)
MWSKAQSLPPYPTLASNDKLYLPPRQVQRGSWDSSESISSHRIIVPRARELFAWMLVVIQFILLVTSQSGWGIGMLTSSPWSMTMLQQRQSKSMFRINGHDPSFYSDIFERAHQVKLPKEEKTATTAQGDPLETESQQNHRGKQNNGISFFDPPTVYPVSAGLVSRVWHSNGNPNVNPGFERGSCWCSADEYCMCTPALGVDIILAGGPNQVWLVRRKDNGKFALPGGYCEIAQTTEESVMREVEEELNIKLPEVPTLFGVYSDPMRDSRRHAVSIIYVANLPPGVQPNAGDDASQVHLVNLDYAIETLDIFIDHKTALVDYRTMLYRKAAKQNAPPLPKIGDGASFKRSVCSSIGEEEETRGVPTIEHVNN